MLYTVGAGTFGLIFYFIFRAMGLTMVGIVITVIFAVLGFIIGTLKMPNLAKFKFAQKTGGENLDDIIRRAIKFRTKGRKIYIYREEEKNG